MACDAFFERSIQGRVNDAFPAKEQGADNLLGQPHQLIGTEIWLQEREDEKLLLEGVTRIEFREGEISFHTSLGEEIRVRAEIKKGLLLEKRFVFEPAASPA
jgi:hypothetical protein